MSSLREAMRNARARRERALLTGLGVALAASMLAAAATVGYGLRTGFSRGAAAAGLPDVTMHFSSAPSRAVASRIAALPDLAGFNLGLESTGVSLSAGSHYSGTAVVEQLGAGRRGYAVVAGRDVRAGERGAVLEAGVARSWGVSVGQPIELGGFGRRRVVGLAQAPDDVAYPLAAPHVYLPPARGAGVGVSLPAAASGEADLAEMWLRDPAELDAVLVQARLMSYGIGGLTLLTRRGVGVLIDEAAGIVIALLVALSLMALIAAGVMLAASARAEVQRRLHAYGVRRALGASRAYVTQVAVLEALLVALPAAALGTAAGGFVAAGPDVRLLALLNEPGPGSALAAPLAACFAVAVLLPMAAAAWPAWRAAGAEPVALLAGAELQPSRRRAGHGGLVRLGAHLVAARRARLLATIAVLGSSLAFVLLMLALAGEISTLEGEPAALGRLYQLTAALPASAAGRVAALPGVAGAAPRYEATGADSFALGETVNVISYGGEATSFEAPALTDGRRPHGAHEAEVGAGLAEVLGLAPGSTLALTLPDGAELRLRVAGVVRALEHDGRVAYVPPEALLAAEPEAAEQLAVRLAPGADAGRVAAELGASEVSRSTGVAGRGHALVEALTAVLRGVAAIDALVCLYTLVQALSLTAHERRRTIGVLRACGAGPPAVRRLLAGAALAVAAPAALIAVLLERVLLGPAMGRVAAGYASLPLRAGSGEIALALGGLLVLAAVAAWWVARRACREPIVAVLA